MGSIQLGSDMTEETCSLLRSTEDLFMKEEGDPPFMESG